MAPRPYVDPRFPATLRALRQARGWSLRELGRRAYLSHVHVRDLERAAKDPSEEAAASLDRALEAHGALAGMVTPQDTGPEQRERIIRAVQQPTRLDAAAVAALADVLAAQRRLDDTMDAHLLVPVTAPQQHAVMDMARDARGPAAAALHHVAAEWTQFLGWLHAEAGQYARAVATLAAAADQAAAVGDGTLAAQAANFRGYVERHRGNPRGIVEHFVEAYHTPGATVLQRVGDAAQAAHGYGLLGDHQEAERLLGEAADLLDHADGEAAPTAAYWLTPTFGRLNLGLAYLALGNLPEAEQQLRAGLAGLPPDQLGSEWATEYHRALERAAHG